MRRFISISLLLVFAAAAFTGCVTREMISFAAVQAGVETGFINKFVPVDKEVRFYTVYVPREYDPAKPWPLIVFLHGRGERGDDGLKPSDVGIGHAIRQHPDWFPCLVVMPQCPDTVYWGGAAEDVERAVGLTMQQYNVDKSRVYLTGLSMGGFGTWSYGAERPETFAALMPICGGGKVKDAPALARLPIWAFHGAEDKIVPVGHSREMVDAVKAAGGDIRYTEYDDGGHDIWDRAYMDKKVIRWLLSHRNEAPATPK